MGRSTGFEEIMKRRRRGLITYAALLVFMWLLVTYGLCGLLGLPVSWMGSLNAGLRGLPQRSSSKSQYSR
jgi:nitrate reductase NapE component